MRNITRKYHLKVPREKGGDYKFMLGTSVKTHEISFDGYD